jgi:putative ATPase
MSLFQNQHHPLAYNLSPKSWEDYMGQTHLIGKGKILRNAIENDNLSSLILWGPPGCGKTSLSRLISARTSSNYYSINAVTGKVADIKDVIEKAKTHAYVSERTLLFIDEIHRFNKAQQDALLPEVESGLLTLIGATTENPFFAVIPSLVSRCQIYELHPLTKEELETLFNKAISNFSHKVPISVEIKEKVIAQSNGDARKLLNALELIHASFNEKTPPTLETLQPILQQGVSYDKNTHYDVTSAFIKSMRGSDPDAALYWLAKMILGGESPEFIARRLIIFASEDIGNADPHALILATSLLSAVKFIGYPEAQINLSHVTAYLATAPKSNATYLAIKKAKKAIQDGHNYTVPNHLRDKGDGYLYPHNYPGHVVKQDYLPQAHSFYTPTENGYEKVIKQRLESVKAIQKGPKKNPLS